MEIEQLVVSLEPEEVLRAPEGVLLRLRAERRA